MPGDGERLRLAGEQCDVVVLPERGLQLVVAGQFLATGGAAADVGPQQERDRRTRVLVIVTVVARSAPSGPAWLTVLEVAVTAESGSACSPVRFAYWLTVPTGWPSDLPQLTTSGWVDSQ